MITLHDKTFTPYIAEAKIQEAVITIAGHINHDYAGKQPLFLSILNGAFMFTSDLLKHIAIPCEVSFIKIASYAGTASSGDITTLIGINDDEIKGRDIIILEDIIDTGNTLNKLLPILHAHYPLSVSICTLFYKPLALKNPLNIHYIGMEIENDFVVGYGMDYNGLGRNLKTIYKLNT